MRIVATLSWVVLAVVFGFPAARLAAQTSEPHEPATVPDRPSVEGATLYATYCADCHGKDGKGPGPLASVRMSVPDLQLLAKRNKGVFPLARVEKLLSGTTHSPVIQGGIEMPLWGSVFSRNGADPSARELQVHALVRYLERLQK